MKGSKSKPDAKKKNLSTKKQSSRVTKGKISTKDPNKPKRPPSSFFVFMEEYRKQFKLENPNNKSVAAAGKAGGETWKSLSLAEKAPYENAAAKRKQEYEKKMTAFNKGEIAGKKDEESEKSMSEVNDEDESSEEEGEEEE